MAASGEEQKIKPGILAVEIIALAAALLVLVLVIVLQPRPDPPAPTETIQTTPTTLPQPAANPYGPTDFQYDGNYLTCLSGKSRLGIDVSHHQSVIDWQQVAQAGIEYAMIRVGYRGFGTGEIYADDYAITNLEGALAAGLDVGVYFFSQAITVEEAIEEAEYVLNVIKDYHITMPVVFDWEWVSDTARTAGVDQATLTACTAAFCERVRQAGYDPMLYFNQSQGKDMLHLEQLTDYGFWLAMYTDRMTYPYRLDMWQYTCEGSVPGINCTVDINLYFTYEQ